MTTFRKNTFVKWASSDEQGRFFHVGQVIKHADGMVIFTDKMGGEMGVPEDEGTFKTVTKPKTWTVHAKNIGRTGMNKAVNAAKAAAKPAKKAHKSTKTDGSYTKYHQVVESMKDARPASRKEAIALVVEEVGMTPAGASTYVAKANKELKLW